MWHAAGYFDESDDFKRGYSVAGFIANQHDCVHFDFVWDRKILREYDLEYFKASELNSGTGQFAKFRDDPSNLNNKFSPREKALFDQIKVESIDAVLEFKDLFIGLGVSLILPDYHRLAREYKAHRKIIPAPYFFCAQLIMVQSGFIMNRLNYTSSANQQGFLRPVFDSHDQYSGRAKMMFDDFCLKNPITSSCLLPPHYESEKQYRMLQAADNFAYECRRLLITEEFDTHIPERAAMKRLKHAVYKIYKLDYEALKIIMEAQRPDEIPFEAAIHNRHDLMRELDVMERESEMNRLSESEKVDDTVRKVLSASQELRRREREWKGKRATKKRA